MNGWINRARSKPEKNRWRLILDLGPRADGNGRRQKWITVRGTEKEAKQRLRNLLSAADRGEFVEPSKRTVGQWLEEWLETVKATRSLRTYAAYRNAVYTHILKSDLAAIRLQQLTPSDVERYHHAKADLAPATLRLHHAILSAALKLAVRDGHIYRNVAPLATERPSRKPGQSVVKAWAADEASKVLVAAKAGGNQTAAFLALALDSGAARANCKGCDGRTSI